MEPKGKSKLFIVIILIAILFIALIVVRAVTANMAKGEEDTSKNDVVNVKVAAAEWTTLENTSPLTGRLEAVDEVALVPKVPGEVSRVHVELGDKVSKGAIIFEIDHTQAATSYNQAKVAHDDAKINYDRMTTLYEEGAISQQQYEMAQTSLAVAKETLAAASDGLSNYVVTSPISGYVTSVNISSGTVASQALPAVTIANVDKLEISTSISEHLINKITVGDKVEVKVSSASDIPIIGTVTTLSPAPATGSLTYPMKVTLDKVPSEVKPGMFAEVIIISEKTANVLAVPSEAVLIKGGKTIVATIDGDHKVMMKEVVVGVDNGTQTEIKSGINAGELIVVKGQNYLDETSVINIIE